MLLLTLYYPLPTHTRNVFLSNPLAIPIGFTPKQEVPAQKSRSIYHAIPLFRFDPGFLVYRLHYPSFPSEHHANLLLSICFFCSFSNCCSYPTQGSYNTQARFLNDKRHNFWPFLLKPIVSRSWRGHEYSPRHYAWRSSMENISVVFWQPISVGYRSVYRNRSIIPRPDKPH